MRNFPDSYVSRVLFAVRGCDVVAQRRHQLTTAPFEPFRPELRYVRHPGQKWQAHRTRG